MNFATELLVAAQAHFDLFQVLARNPDSISGLAQTLGLAPRAMQVLVTGLRASGILEESSQGVIRLTPTAAEHLLPGSGFYIGDYFERASGAPGVIELVRRLRTNRPEGSDDDEKGVGFLFRDGLHSAMEEEKAARDFTLVLAGRAKNVAPVLAKQVPLATSKCLLDVGGGTGIYSIGFLRANPNLRAIVWDRPEVLKVAVDFSVANDVGSRLELRPGNMFSDPVPEGIDTILLSNILHDWDVPECRALLQRCAAALPRGGRLLVHDVFLADDLGGPLAAALYSTALFCVTEGRLYSGAEYRRWIEESGLRPDEIHPTLANCSVLVATKP